CQTPPPAAVPHIPVRSRQSCGRLSPYCLLWCSLGLCLNSRACLGSPSPPPGPRTPPSFVSETWWLSPVFSDIPAGVNRYAKRSRCFDFPEVAQLDQAFFNQCLQAVEEFPAPHPQLFS